jgi:hypothetical protein
MNEPQLALSAGISDGLQPLAVQVFEEVVLRAHGRFDVFGGDADDRSGALRRALAAAAAAAFGGVATLATSARRQGAQQDTFLHLISLGILYREWAAGMPRPYASGLRLPDRDALFGARYILSPSLTPKAS